MKSLYILITLFPFSLCAQPVITSVENYSSGMTVEYKKCDERQAGASGAAITWDFSSLSPTSTPDYSFKVQTNSNTLYPTADLVQIFSDSSKVYIKKSTSANEQVGYRLPVGPNELLVEYTNSQVLAKRPLQYNDQYADSFAFKYTLPSGGGMVRGAGTVSATVDGYGKLILPNATFENVLRVKIITQKFDTLLSNNYVETSYSETYKWYNNDRLAPLLVIDSTISNSVSVKKDCRYLEKESVNVKTLKPESNVLKAFIYHNHLTITDLNENNTYVVRLYDLSGREVYKEGDIRHKSKLVRSINLPTGIYIVNIYNKENSVATNRKIFVRN